MDAWSKHVESRVKNASCISILCPSIYLSIFADHLEDGLVNFLGVGSAQVMSTSLNKVKRSLRARGEELDMFSRHSLSKHMVFGTLDR